MTKNTNTNTQNYGVSVCGTGWNQSKQVLFEITVQFTTKESLELNTEKN